jgi:hypothetical protein
LKKERFQRLLKDQLATLQALSTTKGEEYARAADDQLANFKRQAEELGVSQDKILAVFLNKHLDAIKYYIKTGETLSEPIEGRIDDAVLYLVMLKAMIVEAYEADRGV